MRRTFLLVRLPKAVLVAAAVAGGLTDSALATTQVPTTTYTQNTTWATAGSPYVVNGVVTVAGGAALTIDPGVIVKFNGGVAKTRAIKIAWGARLVAAGTAIDPIYFTALKDDSIGGDTGGDGPTTCSAGVGGFVEVQSGDPLNSISNAILRCSNYGPGKADGLIRVAGSGSTLTVADVSISLAQGSGLYVVGGTLSVSHAEVNAAVVGVMVGLNGAAQIDDSTIFGTNPNGGTGNGEHGVRVEDGTVAVNRSTLRNLAFGAAVHLSSTTSALASSFFDNTIRDNGYGVSLSAIPPASALPPLAQLPYGHRNNIYFNGGTAPNQQQLAAGGPTSEGLDWSNNYWGPTVYWFENPSSCASIGFPTGYVAFGWALPTAPASPTRTKFEVIQGEDEDEYCTKTWADLGGETGFASEPFVP